MAWSERSGYDGEQMGIFGRIFSGQGQALSGSEFQINAAWQASQWRPLIATHPGGGWVVAWSGDWDGDAFIRRVASDGTFLTPDIPVDTIGNGAQVDTALAIAPDGTTLVCFVDYSGFAGVGSGTNLWYRLFDGAGDPLWANEFPLIPSSDPRSTSASPAPPQTASAGSSWSGRTLRPTARAGDLRSAFRPARNGSRAGVPGEHDHPGAQRSPRVAADESRRFAVTWTDFSASSADVMARHFDAQGLPTGDEIRVHSATGGAQELPSLALGQSGATLVFCYEGPGVQEDVYTRTYTTVLPPTSYCTAGTSAAAARR